MIVEMIRHGEVPGNREHRYVGVTEESLTAEGRQTAEQMAKQREGEPLPDLVFSSPRIRCIQTAEILYPGCEVLKIDGLAECVFGAFEYKNYRELTGDPNYQAWIDSGGTIGFPGGEDMQTFRDRSTAAFRNVVEEAEAQGASKIALTVHGGTIMAILAELADPADDYFAWQCGNLEGYRGCYADGKLRDLVKISGT